MLNAVLQAGSGDCKVDRRLIVLAGHQCVNQSAAEAVSAADTVNDMDAVGGRKHGLVARRVIQHSRPVVIAGGQRAAQRDGDLSASEALRDLARDADIARMVELAAVNVGIFRLDPENVLRVFFVRNAHINVGQQLCHDLAGLLARPQLFSVIEVAGNGYALFLCGLARLQAGFRHLAAQSRSNSGPVEPVSALKNAIPVEFLRLCRRDRRPGAVIYDLGRALGRAFFTVVHAQTRAAAQKILRIDPVAPQFVDNALSYLMCRNLADKGGIHTIIRERNRDVRFSSGIAHLEAVRLHEAKVPLRVQAHHNLTKSYCFHGFLLMYVNFSEDGSRNRRFRL